MRNIYEVAHALMNLKVLVRYEEYTKNNSVFTVGESFFGITIRALHSDMIAHAIKVLDKNADSTTFWYVLDKNEQDISNLNSYSIEQIDNLHILCPQRT